MRLAETPRQYIPRWSDEIWSEVSRNLMARRKLSAAQIAYLIDQVQKHFPEAAVVGYEPLIELMENDKKDRHVLAAAVKCRAQVVVTSNLRDFPESSMVDWGIEAQHPDDFLSRLFDADSELVVSNLQGQAGTIGRTLPELLRTLSLSVPKFSAQVGIELQRMSISASLKSYT